MPNFFNCSDGVKITEATIKTRLSKSYREKYNGNECCEGCGERAQGSAHIIPKSRLKILGLSDKIYHPDFYFASCYKCNTICENVSTIEFTRLMNYPTIVEVIKKYDYERYTKCYGLGQG